MIRAHLATFPPRKEMMIKCATAISKQVDRLFVCLNEYNEIPEELTALPNVHAEIPQENLMDVGKFMFEPDPDDWVVTIDDDLDYPEDYVARFMGMTDRIDMSVSVLGYLGMNPVSPVVTSTQDFELIRFRRHLSRFTGTDVLGTGTSFFKGSNFPDLEYMRSSAKFVDVRAGQWYVDHNVQAWMVPREQNYLRPFDAGFDRGYQISTGSSLSSKTQMCKELGALFGQNDHIGQPYFRYHRAKRRQG